SWEVLERALDGLDLPVQETLRLRDVVGWEQRDACDALGLTEAEERALLHEGRTALCVAVRDHLAAPPWPDPPCGTPPLAISEHLEGGLPLQAASDLERHLAGCGHCADRLQWLRGISTLLGMLRQPPGVQADPELHAIFRRWRAGRRLRLWHRLLAR
ncbi:MAG: hypothetical protein H0V19_05455, partial [Euzebyales bacterium]|nr:hypothetical protein [Euzebyales bacterium]